MQNKNNINAPTGGRYNNSPTESFSIENIPIYSMKKDLEIIAHPEMAQQKSTSASVPSNLKYTSSLKDSPFFKKPEAVNTPIISLPTKKLDNDSEPDMIHLRSASTPVSSSLQYASSPKISPFLEEIAPAKEPVTSQKTLEKAIAEPSGQNALKKVFLFSSIILFLVASGLGSYYFWVTKEKTPKTPPLISTPTEESPSPIAVIEPPVETEEPKENILVLDLTNSDLVTIKTAIENQIKKVPKESLNELTEFKLKDTQNNPLTFSSFAQKSQIAFPQNLSTYLGESFSLFFFNDGPNLGTGLIVDSKNDSLLAQELLKIEMSLPKNLDILFLPTAPEKTRSVSFSDFTYKGIPLRYFNLISQEELSVDYAVAKNKLLIGTTRNTFSALCDWLLLQLENK